VTAAAAPVGRPGPGTRVRARFAALVALIVAAALAAALLPLHRIPDTVARIGAWAPYAAVGAGALLLAALVPRTAISLACGALFGAVEGGLVGVAAALLAATGTFAAGRWLGREALARHAGDRLGRLDSWLARQGVLGVLVVRLLPLAPYGLIGYAYGTTGVRVRDYLGGTLIASSPSAFIYAALGAAVVRPGEIRPVTFVPAGIGLLITCAAAVYWRRSGRGGPGGGAGGETS
jgi:uncharacterized membrane protein YdjX (TVP38/TMEM64 family)